MLELLDDEKIVFKTQKHPIIFLTPALWALFALVLFSQMHHTVSPMIQNIGVVAAYNSYINLIIVGGPLLIAMVLGANQLLIYLTSVFIVTDRRVLLKEGFFIKHTNETRLTAIAQVNVNQSLIGQLFSYGSISINTFGNTNDGFDQIAQPFAFQKTVNQQLDLFTRRNA